MSNRIVGAYFFTIILLSATFTACGSSFESFGDLIRSKAGANSNDCGIVTLYGSRSDAIACAQAALSQRMAFKVIFEVQGIDSKDFLGLAVGNGGKAVLPEWDSDIKGGGGFLATSRINERTCLKPRVVDEFLPVLCE
jgi:hypothetical protein